MSAIPLTTHQDDMFRMLADNIPQMAWAGDPQGNLFWYNKRWYDYTGTTLDEMKGWGWQKVHHPEHLDRVVEYIKQCFESGTVWEDTFPLRSKEGEYRWFLSRAEPIKDATGAILFWFGTNTDITEQRALEEQLRFSEARFRDMADSVNHMIWVTKPDGYHEYYNKRWYEYTGVPDGSTDGDEWNGMFHAEDQERAWDRWQHSLSTGEPYEIEYRLRHRNGDYRWVLGRALPLRNENGEIIKWFGTCTDIHDLKEAEVRAEAANIAKSEFLANMSHEIRTPLNSIVGLSTIVAQHADTPDSLKEFANTIEIASKSLLDLVNDLLDISKIESQHLQIELIPFDLQTLIHEVVRINRVKAQETSLTLEEIVTSEAPLHFKGDRARIRQILLNLVNNAIKFTEKGSVKIEYSVPDNPNYNIQIDVTDTGIGIEQSKVSEIFNKFTQADSSITRRFGGTGLGLAISRGLAEQMGGTLSVASEVGKGTTFTLLLQLESCADESQQDAVLCQPEASNRKEGETSTILLVEDYAANVLVATHTLKSMGFEVDVAENGLIALDILQKQDRPPYRAVLMDMQMPKLDGLETTKRLRAYEKENSLPPLHIIAMTANAFVSDKQACLEAGMDNYISKPFDPDELEMLLQKAS